MRIVDIARVLAVCVMATVLIVMLRSERPEIAIWLSIVTAVIVFASMLGHISFLVRALTDLASRTKAGNVYFVTVLKVIGVAYLAGFGAEVCRDAGEGAIATRLEFAGKVIILVMALPVLVAVLETIVRFLR
ncbi:MAG: stage III sporulation protein AD [Bacillota bacterium]